MGNTIENETDKEEWFFNVRKSDVDNDEAEESFVVAYFCDESPWNMVNDKCLAVTVWMDAARQLIEKYLSIATIVNPEILEKICPNFQEKQAKHIEINDDDNKEKKEETKDKEKEKDDDESSDEMPSPPPQYYAKQMHLKKEAEATKQDDDEKDLTDHSNEEEDALRPRALEDDDDDD